MIASYIRKQPIKDNLFVILLWLLIFRLCANDSPSIRFPFLLFLPAVYVSEIRLATSTRKVTEIDIAKKTKIFVEGGTLLSDAAVRWLKLRGKALTFKRPSKLH